MAEKETLTCPQCAKEFGNLQAIRRHLKTGVMGEPSDQGRRTWECPPWPAHQIKYYEEQGLFVKE